MRCGDTSCRLVLISVAFVLACSFADRGMASGSAFHSSWDDWADEINADSSAPSVARAEKWGRIDDNCFLESGHDSGEFGSDDEGKSVQLMTGQHKRGRGRPKGSFASAALRRKAKESQLQRAQTLASQGPQPGSIEYARAHLKRPLQGEQNSVQQSTEEFLSPASSVWACLKDLGSPAQLALVTAAQHSYQHEGPEARDNSECAHVLGFKSEALMSNAAVNAALRKAGLQDIAHVGRVTISGASAAVLAGGVMWSGLLQAVCDKPEWECVFLIQKLRYDETPLRVRLTAQGQVAKSGQEVALQGKILQYEHEIYLLVRETSSGRHLLIAGQVPACLQTCDRMTAECLVKSINNVHNTVPDFVRLKSCFPRRLRVAVSRPGLIIKWCSVGV